MAESPVIQFRALDDLQGQIDSRTSHWISSRGDIARRDLARYYHVLASDLRAVNLTEGEASLICDACNGTAFVDNRSISMLWAEIDDAIRLDGLDDKWHVDGPALVEKLRTLTWGQTAAIVDAVERFWADPNPLQEKLREVGLIHAWYIT